MVVSLRQSVLLIALALLLAACGSIEQEPPTDDEGEPIPMPDTYDRWLELNSVAPAADQVTLRPTLAFQFNDYLDPDSFRSYTFASLYSGGIRQGGFADYVMTTNTVYWRPWGDLDEGLQYRLSVNDELGSATGAPFVSPAAPVRYTATRQADPGPSPVELPSARWPAVDRIIERRCADCHRDPSWGLNPLTYDSLVGARSEQVDRYLVRPRDAADSYLMRKLLWDYPDRRFSPQPPPWDGGQQLPQEELLTVEGWIAAGARR